MSKYTTELRFICETNAGLEVSEGYLSVKEIIEKSREKIFNFDYPIFDVNYKPILETKILRHFYTREISEETVGLWKLRLEAKLNEIMPYYNKLYNSELIEFNPLYTTNMRKITEGNNKSNKVYNENISGTSENKNDTQKASNEVTQFKNKLDENSTLNATNNGVELSKQKGSNSNERWDKYSDTPQGSISNIENDTYLTNARNITDGGSNETSSNNMVSNKSNSNNTLSNTASGNNASVSGEKISGVNNENFSRKQGSVDNTASTENYLENIVGYNGVDANKLIDNFRKNFLNIDVTIINELEVLFMQLW